MSKTKVIELRQKRAKLITDARALLEAAGARALTQEEQNNWDAMMSQSDTLKGTIDREERMLTQETEMQEPVYASLRPDPASTGSERSGGGGQGGQQIEFRSRAMRGTDQMDPGWRDNPEWRKVLATGAPGYRNAFRSFVRGQPLSPELRSLQADLDTQGGYLMTPIQMVDAIIKAVDDAVYMRQWATVYAVPNADSLGVPVLENDPADADWTTELAIGDEDTTMSLGRRELHPHPLAKLMKISRKLIMKVPNAEDLAVSRLGYKFAITAEKGYLTGSGSQSPLGVFTASADGIPTSRDVSTDNTTTSVSTDGLINAKYSLKQQYWTQARWMGHRDFYKQVSKLKSGDGQYLWRESVRVGEPDRLLNFPCAMSEYAPSSFVAGAYVGIVGDFSHYWIADSMSMTMQRLIELFAATNQIGLIGRLDSDGQPVLGEAFARVQLAAS